MNLVRDEAPSIPTTKAPMSRSSRAFLAGVREEVLEPVNAIIMFSDMLLAEARDIGQETFVADLRRIHAAGQTLREMVQTFLGPDQLAGPEADAVLAAVQSRVRHDMRNALNPVINYTEMWLEEAEEQFLQGFVPDLQRIHDHGRRCLALLDKIAAYQLEAAEADGIRAPVEVAEVIEALGQWEGNLDRLAVVEPGYCLVVDDNATNRDILCRLLQRQGHRTATAVNGREALEMVGREHFDIVLLDILMPEMNGFQVLRHLKADEKLREIPVIMISALDQDDAVLRCIAMGAEDYLPRPFNPLLLKARLGACLEKKRFRDRETQYLRQIEQEKQKADDLLHVILPHQIVEELKATNEVRPRRYDNVAVLFADLVGFTPFCETRSPEEVVPHLQNLVEAWENSAVRHGVEKIKTIGDAFMAAGGLLRGADNPVLSCLRCGVEMIDATRGLGIGWDLRVGIHVGQVVAGVIGRRQYLFDLWGDTVNTAARMESHGLNGSITLSGEAWQWVSPHSRAEPFQREVKGLGLRTLYRFVEFAT